MAVLPDDYDEIGDRGVVWVNRPRRRKTFEERTRATAERIQLGDQNTFEEIRVSARTIAMALGGIANFETGNYSELLEDFKGFQKELDRQTAQEILTRYIGAERQLRPINPGPLPIFGM